ncbi:MAG: mannose-1-phosphate guanylyltransferase [Candidatus Rokuibacteriota bacterium]
MTVYAAILAGGGGTRLWPASRRRRPKQFLPLAPGGRSLLEATVARVRPLVPIERVLVVAAASQAADVRASFPELLAANLVVEPVGRNTAPAIALAARVLERRGEAEAVMAVLASDHAVSGDAAYAAAFGQAAAAAERHLVAIGIRPTHPETGYGYLELGERREGAVREVRRFVEKPDLDRARQYVAAGHYLWNASMFFFRVDRILEETRRHLPEVARALDHRYEEAPSISIDYGVMERTQDIWAVPGEFAWSDVGSWADLAVVHPTASSGDVRIGGPLVAVDSKRNVVVGEKLVALLGVEGLVVVTTDDAVLVMPRERAQDVRAVVAELERRRLDAYL